MTFKKSVFWILAAGIIIAASLSYPAYREIRIWRASEMAKEAEEMLTSPETMNRAWELAHAAKALNPESPSIARSLARVYSASNPNAAYQFWQSVVELSKGASADRLELAKAYLNAKKWQDFEAEVSKQRKDNLHPQQLNYLETLAAMLQGKYDDALKMATALVGQGNAPEEADTLFFQLTLASPDPLIRRAGIDHLWKIASEEGPRKQEAIHTLARLSEFEASDIQRLINTISQRQDNSREMRLLIEELRLRSEDANHLSTYNRARKLFKLNEPSEMAIFGRWLNRHGLHHYTPSAIPLDTAISRQDLFLIYIDALALDNEWKKIQPLLNRSRVPLEDYLTAFFKARTLIEIGDERRARLAWDQALIAAARDNAKLYYLALKARQLNLHDFEISALQRVIESSEMRERAIKELIAVQQRQGRTADLHATMRQYIKYFPGEKSSENDTLYLSFLTEKASPNSLSQAQKLLESEPNILAYRMTLVLGLLRQNRPEDAIKLLDGLPVNWFEVRDRWRLLAAISLYRTGFEKDAQKLSAQMNPSNLLPEEQVFLREINSAK